MITERNEYELVIRARSGDQQALSELVELARVKLYPAAYAELRHYDDAQDAVGSALLQICLHLQDLREPDRWRGWMYSIVRNEARRLLRARIPEAPDALVDDEEAPAALPSSLLRIDIERALYRLPWDEARAVALFYLKGQSIREIARFLERPEGTVKRWLHLGRRQLAQELEAYAPMTPAMRHRLRRVLVYSVGKRPTRVVTDPTANRIYVANDAGILTVIDGASREIAAVIGVGRGAMALAVHPASNRIYVSHSPVDTMKSCGALSVIDGRTLSVIAVVDVGNTPRAVAVNPETGKVYVASVGDNLVNVIDGVTNQVNATIPVGSEPVSLALDPGTNKVYVANWGSCNLSVIDGAADVVRGTVEVGAFPTDVAVNPRTHRVYTANSQDDTISVVDGNLDCVLATVPVGRHPVGLAINASTNEIYVTHSPEVSGRGTLRMIDGSNNQLTATTPIGGGSRGVAVDAATNNVYVADAEKDTVSVIRAA